MKKVLLLSTFILTACTTTTSTPTSTLSPTATPLSSLTPLPALSVTATLDSKIQLVVRGETFTVTRDVKYRDGQTAVDIDPSKAQKIGELLVYSDASGRLIWNEHMAAWTPEFGTNMDYSRPELSPYVPLDAFYDGSKPGDATFVPSSVALSDRLYLAEHPEIIAADATFPYYRITLAWSDQTVVGYEIALTGPNQYLLTDEPKTDTSRNVNRSFAYFGLQQTLDRNNNIIYGIKKANLNPTPTEPDAILATTQGFDEATYDEWFQYAIIYKYLTNTPSMTGEITPMFPLELGVYRFDKNTFFSEGQPVNPNVASLLNTEMIAMFDADTQQEIIDLYNGVGKQFDATTNRMSISLDSLPPDLSNMILYTTVHQFYK